jgi:hypothetical protein
VRSTGDSLRNPEIVEATYMEIAITLFDGKNRADRRLPRLKEPLFNYLNDPARRPVASIRKISRLGSYDTQTR